MNTEAKPSYKNPILWVPTSYFAMGTVYTMVTTAANIMFANLGLPNDQSALYSSLTGFAFTFKPLWAPLLELGKTKKFFVVLMQFILAAVFMAMAVALKMPAFIVPAVVLLMVAALAGATQDLVTDGVYVTTLSNKHMAAFSGVQSMSWSIGPIVAGSALVLLVGVLAGETSGAPRPPVASYTSAWLITFILLGALMVGMAFWHTAFLPQGSKAADAPKSLGDGVVLFGRIFATFFEKKDVWKLLGFAFFYRFGLGLLDKVSVLFLLDTRAHGGLGLDNSKLGLLNGIATLAFIGGSLVGGWIVAERGLKRSLLILCLLLNVPNVTFLYLGWFQPQSIYIIGLIFCIEKLGWGIGAVGHMVYMMQQIAPGRYKMAHYAFATGFGLSLCMTLTGAVSGYIQQAVGYQTYFVIVLLAAAPSILFTLIAPFHHSDSTESVSDGSRPLGTVRNPWLVILAGIFTCGLYTFYYYYLTFKETRNWRGNGWTGGRYLLFAIVPGLNLVSLAVPWLLPAYVGRMYHEDGQAKPITGLSGFWIFLPLVGGIVLMVSVQNHLNRFWISKGAKA